MTPQPTRARLVLRRLKTATGIAGIGELEDRVAGLEVGVAESRALEGPLAALLDDVESRLVPLLEQRVDRA